MSRIIGVNTNCYHGYSLEEALEGIAAAGFRYVELTATKGWTEHVFPDMSFARLDTVKRKMEQLRLVPFAMSGHCNLMAPERLEDFRLNIRLAAFYGCDYIVSSIGEAHLEDREITTDVQLAENLKTLLPELEKHQIMLVLETHGDQGTGADIQKIVKLVDSPLVKINYDTANVVFYGGVLPEQEMKSCIEDIAYMHLKDKGGEQKEWNFPALGAGWINFPEVFRLLETSENQCPFSIEIEFTETGAGSLEEINEAVAASYQYLKEKGYDF